MYSGSGGYVMSGVGKQEIISILPNIALLANDLFFLWTEPFVPLKLYFHCWLARVFGKEGNLGSY